MAGVASTANSVNSKVAGLVLSLWDTLDQLNRQYKWFIDATHDDTFLNNIGIPGSSSVAGSDVKLLRDSVSDLGNTTNGLWAVSHGLFIPGGPNNFFANAKKLTGDNYTG